MQDTSGIPGDGANSLASESKVGNAVQFVVTAALTGLGAALVGLDTSHWSGYLGMVGASAVGLVSGLISSYLKTNR